MQALRGIEVGQVDQLQSIRSTRRVGQVFEVPPKRQRNHSSQSSKKSWPSWPSSYFCRLYADFEVSQLDHFADVSFVDCLRHFVPFASFCKKLFLVFRHQPVDFDESHNPAGHASRCLQANNEPSRITCRLKGATRRPVLKLIPSCQRSNVVARFRFLEIQASRGCQSTDSSSSSATNAIKQYHQTTRARR